MELFGAEVPLSGAALGTVILYVAWKLFEDRKYRNIPSVGYTFPILNWITAVQYITNARKLISEGYKKYPNSLFRIAVHDGWLILANGPHLVEEIRRAPDVVLSLTDSAVRLLQLEYTMGNEISDAPYHTDVVRGALTRNLSARFTEMRDEISVAFAEEVGAGEEWKGVPAVKTIQRIVMRVSNRVFFNPTLCRNPEWIQLNIDYAIDVALGALFLKLVPGPLKPLAARLLSKLKTQRQRGYELVGPLISERLREFTANGNQPSDDLPNDMVTWLIEACPPELCQVPLLSNRVLMINFTSLHSSANTFLHVLYKIASKPEYAGNMREEAKRVVAAEGWSKASLAKMRRVDSFIREVQRIHTNDLTSMNRWVNEPFTFSNGVRIPAGCQLACPADAIQTDEANYGEDAAEFTPWRFADIKGKDGASKAQIVATSPTHLPFGHGLRACPGRYLVANELKGMLAHIVLEYDVRFKDGKVAPPDLQFANNVIPRETQVEFRKRRAAV